ncbi:hypothetical protein [Frankia sp. CcWB2]
MVKPIIGSGPLGPGVEVLRQFRDLGASSGTWGGGEGRDGAREAQGLLVLSGGAPGSGWCRPVMIQVPAMMRDAKSRSPAPRMVSRMARSRKVRIPVRVIWSEPTAKAMAAVKTVTSSTARMAEV